MGEARQYCGTLGKLAPPMADQAGVFLAHVGTRGRASVDKRLYLPEERTGDGERSAATGMPVERRPYRSKTELALEMRSASKPEDTSGSNGCLGIALSGCRPRYGKAWRRRECSSFGRPSRYDGMAAGAGPGPNRPIRDVDSRETQTTARGASDRSPTQRCVGGYSVARDHRG